MSKNQASQDRSPIARFYDALAPFYTRLREYGHRRDHDSKELLIDTLAPFRDDTVLDIGTGPGIYAIDIAKRAERSRVIGIDISEAFVRIAKGRAAAAAITNVEFARGNVEQLHFEDDRFTKVICAGVLSVVDRREQAVNEIARVLKPGGCLAVREPRRSEGAAGRFIASLPAKSKLRQLSGRLGLMFGHFSPEFMTETEMKALFTSSGFSSVRIEPRGPDIFIEAIK